MAFMDLNNVGKTFVSRKKQRFDAVSNFSLQINEGEFFCLLGPSGCGKSTVLSMIAGFEQPSSGEIVFQGKRVEKPSSDRGVIFQGDDSLYPWLNALDNIAFGLRLQGQNSSERNKCAMKYLELVGLSGQQDKHPPELSGGMKQRIQIARGLAPQPKMLLMDEPFGALDAQTRHIMQHELRKIWTATGTTIFFITHDVDEAILLGTRIGVMSASPAGTLKSVVNLESLQNRERSNPEYQHYYSIVYEMIREEVMKSTMHPQNAAV